MPTVPALKTAEVFRELVAEVLAIQERVLADPGLDERSRIEAHRWILSMLRTGVETQVWADPDHPRFVDIVGPSNKWGGDNSDAFYQYAPLDPARTYRVRGRRGDSVYLSLTVYGGPSDGRYSERIVGSVNDRSLTFNPDGSFELILGPGEDADLRLEPDAVCALTRDYLAEPRGQLRPSGPSSASTRPPGAAPTTTRSTRPASPPP